MRRFTIDIFKTPSEDDKERYDIIMGREVHGGGQIIEYITRAEVIKMVTKELNECLDSFD